MYKYLLGLLLVPSIVLGADFDLVVESLLTANLQPSGKENEDAEDQTVRIRTNSNAIRQRKDEQAKESKILRDQITGAVAKLGMPTAEDLFAHALSNRNQDLSVETPLNNKSTIPEQAAPLRSKKKRGAKNKQGACCTLL